MIPICSSRVLTPSRIRITPPKISAFFSYFAPNRLPAFTPIMERIRVVTPMSVTEGTMPKRLVLLLKTSLGRKKVTFIIIMSER